MPVAEKQEGGRVSPSQDSMPFGLSQSVGIREGSTVLVPGHDAHREQVLVPARSSGAST
jgi:hypothetical protein